jgi:hypothetical protein
MENQEQAQVATEEGVAPQAPQPELSITDLQNLRGIISVAVKRGAFEAAELTPVGAVFDRLNAFLNAVAPAAPAPQAPEQAPAA